MRRFATALVLLLAVTAATAKPRIAIIIDDRIHGMIDLPTRHHYEVPGNRLAA